MKKIVQIFLFILLMLPVSAQLRAVNNRFPVGGGDNPTIKIFPNPASDYIELTQNDKVSKVVVFNLVGKEMRRFDAGDGQRHNISDLPKGLYLVQLLDKAGQTIVTQRVSKR